MPGKHGSIVERFWLKVEKRDTDECWSWCGGKSERGYGQLSDGRHRSIRSHRISYEIHKGAIPDRMLVLHSCDNPSCVNPAHLSLGTQLDNMADKCAKGRLVAPIGERNGQAKITTEQARQIKLSMERSENLATMFGISAKMVRNIRTGRSWKHIGT